MSYGFTPYDKKSYKESKMRRRQAIIAAETGRILPYGSVKRKVIAGVLAAVLIIFAVAAIFALTSYFGSLNAEDTDTVENINNDELLVIVNRQNTLKADYVPNLKKYGKIKVSKLMYDDLSEMINAAESVGVKLKIKSAYVSFDDQQKMYEEKLAEYLAKPNYTQVRAQAAVQKLVPRGGQSERQTGLVVEFDISDKKTNSYLERNCVKYGFILRYPKDKESATSMLYDKSLYRYVGKDNSVKMRSYDMCLEEYSNYLSLQKNGE